MKTIAIIGSSGTNARPWTGAFLAAGWAVRRLVRDPRKIENRPHLGAAAFDFGDPHSYAPALAGIDVLALISPALPDQTDWERALIAAAQRAAVGGVIQLSVLGAEMAEPISLFRPQCGEDRASLARFRRAAFDPARQRLHAKSAAPARSDRGGQFHRAVRHDGVKPRRRSRPCRCGRRGADGPFDGRVLTLTGPAALTGEEIAATLSDVLGRPVRYISPPLPQFRAALTERGLPA